MPSTTETAKGVQVYVDPKDAYPGRVDGPPGKDGRPSFVVYQRPESSAWMFPDAEAWAFG
jgi:hypothetical protein